MKTLILSAAAIALSAGMAMAESHGKTGSSASWATSCASAPN